jgi:hypothetical protein
MDSKRLGFVKHSCTLNIGRCKLKWLHEEKNDLLDLEMKRESRKANNRKETATV